MLAWMKYKITGAFNTQECSYELFYVGLISEFQPNTDLGPKGLLHYCTHCRSCRAVDMKNQSCIL